MNAESVVLPTMGIPDVVLSIEGMMCQKNCGSTVQTALSNVPNVKKAVVTFANKEAQIWGNVSSSILISAVESVGFDAAVSTESTSSTSSSSSSSSVSSPTKKSKTKEIDDARMKNSNLDHEKKIDNKEFKIEGRSVLDMRVGGMSCTSCVNAVERGLMQVRGVVSVKVALLAEKAEIVFDNSIVTEGTIVAATVALGYSASILSTRKMGDGGAKKEMMFKVTGMSCANCAIKLERTLKGKPGVVEIGVSAVTNKARVVVDGDITNALGPRDVTELIEGIGFGCDLISGAGGSSDNQGDGMEDMWAWAQLLFFAAVLGLPVLVLHMSMTYNARIKMYYMRPGACDGNVSKGQVIMALLNIPMQFGVGYRFYKSAFIGLMHKNYGMDLLVVTGTSITFIYSFVQLSLACIVGEPTTHIFFEASGMLLMFVTFGKFLEAYAKGKTVSAITNLLSMQPRQALLVVTDDDESAKKRNNDHGSKVGGNSRSYGALDAVPANSTTSSSSGNSEKTTGGSSIAVASLATPERLKEISVDLVQKGDVLKVLPGSRIPTDGCIVSGSSYIDESMITGESVPVLKRKDDIVFGSTVNQLSPLYIKATAVGSDGALAQIVRMVEAAQMNKAPVQAYADRIAGVFTPIVLSLSLLTYLVWSMLAWTHSIPQEWFQDEYGDPQLFAMLFAISVVVISCPCALGLATPTAIMVGTSVGAQHGILIKGGVAFETAHSIQTVIFDKTGTLTMGRPEVIDIVALDVNRPGTAQRSSSSTGMFVTRETAADKLLRVAATAEQGSEHPLATAVLKAAQSRFLCVESLSEDAFEVVVGSGVRCKISDGMALVGNKAFLEKNGITDMVVDWSKIEAAMYDLQIQGKTAVCVALNAEVLGVLGIADVPKPEALLAVTVLRAMGMDIWMCTGDNKVTAESIASEFGIPRSRVVSGAMPQDKVAKVEQLQKMGQSVAMVGDGVNDSPALARANLGIAIGAGTHVAIEAADMVLVRSNLTDVVVAIDLAQVVFRRIRWNFMFALMYNIIAIPFAAGVWYPFTHMQVPPQYAGLSMALSSVSVVCSSMALKLYKKPMALRMLADITPRAGEGQGLDHNTSADQEKWGAAFGQTKRNLENAKERLTVMFDKQGKGGYMKVATSDYDSSERRSGGTSVVERFSGNVEWLGRRVSGVLGKRESRNNAPYEMV